jgi:hypothetical protein
MYYREGGSSVDDVLEKMLKEIATAYLQALHRRISSVTTAGFRAEIRTRGLPNTKQGFYPLNGNL